MTAHTLSPFHIPKSVRGVLSAKHRDNAHVEAFWGLFGLFADSLPDAFGLAVCRQRLKEAEFESGVMELLAYQGQGGRGALTYDPVVGETAGSESTDISEVYRAALRVSDGDIINLDEATTYAMGTAGGTRPKASVQLLDDGTVIAARKPLQSGQSYMVKFDCTGQFDGRIDNETRNEAACIDAARDCGIEVPEYKILEKGDRYHLALKRFDRTPDSEPVHFHSYWGIRHAITRGELSTYEEWTRTALALTRDQRVAQQCLRRIAFNAFVGNQDDHPKQHGFLLSSGRWTLAPAYDLTVSPSPLGHAMTLGRSSKITRRALLEFAEEFRIARATEIVEQVQDVVSAFDRYLEAHCAPPRKEQLRRTNGRRQM